MKILTIERGAAGSGKTTHAMAIQPNPEYRVAADDYFVVNGEYCFDASKLSLAHADCQRRVGQLLVRGAEHVVVHNTNIKLEHLDPYLELGITYGYTIHIVEHYADYGSVHNVPLHAVQRMQDQFEPYHGSSLEARLKFLDITIPVMRCH